MLFYCSQTPFCTGTQTEIAVLLKIALHHLPYRSDIVLITLYTLSFVSNSAVRFSAYVLVTGRLEFRLEFWPCMLYERVWNCDVKIRKVLWCYLKHCGMSWVTLKMFLGSSMFFLLPIFLFRTLLVILNELISFLQTNFCFYLCINVKAIFCFNIDICSQIGRLLQFYMLISSVLSSVDSVENLASWEYLCTVCRDTCFAASAVQITASRTEMDLAGWVAEDVSILASRDCSCTDIVTPWSMGLI